MRVSVESDTISSLGRAAHDIGAAALLGGTLFGRELGTRMHVLALALPRLNDGDFNEVAHDLLDVATDISDLGEFCRFHLEEGRAREPRQAA